MVAFQSPLLWQIKRDKEHAETSDSPAAIGQGRKATTLCALAQQPPALHQRAWMEAWRLQRTGVPWSRRGGEGIRGNDELRLRWRRRGPAPPGAFRRHRTASSAPSGSIVPTEAPNTGAWTTSKRHKVFRAASPRTEGNVSCEELRQARRASWEVIWGMPTGERRRAGLRAIRMSRRLGAIRSSKEAVAAGRVGIRAAGWLRLSSAVDIAPPPSTQWVHSVISSFSCRQ